MGSDAKTEEDEDYSFDFPFTFPWYGWVLIMIVGLLFAVFVVPTRWVRDQFIGFKEKCHLAVMFHRAAV